MMWVVRCELYTRDWSSTFFESSSVLDYLYCPCSTLLYEPGGVSKRSTTSVLVAAHAIELRFIRWECYERFRVGGISIVVERSLEGTVPKL